MRGNQEVTAAVIATLIVVSLFGIVTALGAGAVGAVHPSGAQDVTEHANFTVNFPNAEDHYPDREEEGSIEYFAAGEDSFHEMGAEEGIYYDWIIVHAEYDGEDWIDYSACDTENTKAFGIDRGNNNTGTQIDEDLVTHRKDSEFRDDGIVIEFYDWEDPFEDPPYMAPEDAVVAAQGEGSAGGPCLTLTDEPGWYRIVSFANATVADNGPDEQPSEDAEYVEFQLASNYLYVCECDSEEEARAQLGDPPNERDDDGSEDDGSEDDGAEDDDGSADDGAEDDDGSADDGAEDDDGSADDGSTDDGNTDDGSEDDGSADDGAEDDDGSADDADEGQAAANPEDDDDDGGTPAADGPGFGALAALVALLAAALVAYRRR